MTKKERFLATIALEKTDKPCWWIGMPTAEMQERLFRYYKVKDFSSFKKEIGDDVWTVEMPYENGTTNAIYAAFDFAKKRSGDYTNESRTLSAPGFFEDYEEEEDADRFDWPDPEKYISKEACQAAVRGIPADMPKLGVIWSAHFQDALSAFGMEDALVKMKIAPELFRAVIDRIVRFYLRANEIFYEYTKGELDAVLIGNDFGTQTGLLVSRSDLKEFVFPGTRALIEQAHSYGLKVIHHSCGAIESVIPDLIDCGADAIHPMQALARGMDPRSLHDKYGDRVCFAGGIDAQYLMVHGTQEQISEKIAELESIFPKGLIISPSHEAILPDVPCENVEAIARALR